MNKMKKFKYECYNYSNVISPVIEIHISDFNKDYVVKSVELKDGLIYFTLYTQNGEETLIVSMNDLI